MSRISKQKQLAIRQLRSNSRNAQWEAIEVLQNEVNRLGREYQRSQRAIQGFQEEIRNLKQTIRDLERENRHLERGEFDLQNTNLHRRISQLKELLALDRVFVPPSLDRTFSQRDLG